MFRLLSIGSGRLAVVTALATAAVFSAASAGEPGKPDPRIGEEVNQICFARSINGFRTIDGVDNAVLLEKGVRDVYRVALSGLCNERRLSFAQSVAIVSRPSGGCLTRGDTLVFSDSAFFEDRPIERARCIVTGINAWNDKAGEAEAAPAGKPAD